MAEGIGGAFLEFMPTLAKNALSQLNAEAAKAGEQAGSKLDTALSTRLKALKLPPINLDADPSKALAAIKETEAALNAIAKNSPTATIKIDAQKALAELKGFHTALDDVDKTVVKTGDNVDKGFSAKFKSAAENVSSGTKKFALLGAAVGGVGASFGATIPLIGGTVAAVAPAIGGFTALKGAMVAVKLTTAILKVAVQDTGEAIAAGFGDDAKKATEALSKLPPEAQKFAKSVIALKGPIDDFKKNTSEQLFAPINKGFSGLANQYVPALANKLPGVAGAVGQVAAKFIDAASKGKLLTAVTGYVDNVSSSIKIAGKNVGLLPNAFAQVVGAAGRSLPTIATMFDKIVVAVANFITKAGEAGKIDQFFQKGLATLQKLGQIAVNVGAIFVNVFGHMKTDGQSTLDTIVKFTAKINEWVKSAEGSKKIEAAFAALSKVGQSMGGVVGDALKAIGSSFVALAPAIAAFGGTFAELMKAVTPLLPYFTNLANILLRTLSPVLEKTAKFLQDHTTTAKVLATAIGALVAAVKLWTVAQGAAAVATGVMAAAQGTALVKTEASTAAYIANKVALGAITAAQKIATAAQWLWNAALTANPIGIVVAAIAALVAALVLLYKNNETVRKAIDAAWKAIKIAFSATIDWFTKTAWPAMKTAFDAIVNAVKPLGPLFKTIWDGIKAAIEIAWNAIKVIFSVWKAEFTALGTAANFLWKNVIVPVWNGIKVAIDVAWTAIKVIFAVWLTQYVLIGKAAQALWDLIKIVWEGIKTAINAAWTFIKTSVLDAWQTYIKGPFTAMWNAFKTFFEALWNGIKTFITTTWNAIKTGVFIVWETYIKGPFTAMWNAFKAFFETLWNGLKTFITTTWTAIKTTVFDAWQTYIKGPFTAMWNAFKAFFTLLWNTLKTFLVTTWTAIKTTVFDAWQTYIKGPFTAMWNAFKAFFTLLWNTLKTFLVTTWTAIKTTVFDVWSAYIKGPFTAMWNAFKAFFTLLWNTLKQFLITTWNAIKTTVFDVWSNYIKGPFTAMWNAFKAFLTGLWNAIKSMMQAAWNFIHNSVFIPIQNGLSALKSAFQTFKSGVDSIWSGFKNSLKSGWDWVKSNVFTPLQTLITKTVPGAFNTGVNAIKTAWAKVEEAAKTPVRFVANTVLRDGLFKAYNSIAGKVGAPTISYGGVSFARGGVMPGYTPGRDVHKFVSPTGGRLELSGGEAIMRPEFTRAIGKAGVATLNRAAKTGGVSGVEKALGLANGGVAKFDDGGIVDNTVDAIKRGIASGFNSAKSVASAIISPLSGLVNNLLGKIPGSGPIIDLLKSAVKNLLGQAGKFITGFGGGGRGGGGVGGIGGTNGPPVTGGFQAQIANLARAGFHLRFANSQLTGGGHATNSWHYKGRAIDIGVGTNGQAQVERVWEYLVAHYARTSKELFWAQKSINYKNGQEVGPHDKSNHIHWAMRNGGVFDSGGLWQPGTVGVNAGRKPEAVLTPEESAGLKNMGVGELAELLERVIEAIENNGMMVAGSIRGSGRGIVTKGRSV